MTQLTFDHLKQLIPKNPHVESWHKALEQSLPNYDINTPQRIAAFIAQCSHESAQFTRLEENLNYSAEALIQHWPKRFPNINVANQYARNPQKIANKTYANRMGNGNELSGDGWNYRGRGLIQLTGKNNYQAFADSIQTPIEQMSKYLTTFEGAVQSSCWFWKTNNLNKWVDVDNIKELTRQINGGYNGLEDRIKHYEHALRVMGDN
jgi:putative chitinase